MSILTKRHGRTSRGKPSQPGHRLLACALALAIAVPVHAHAANGRYLVVFKSDTLPADAPLRIVANGGKVTRAFNQIGVVAVIGDSGFVSRMQKDSKILTVGAENVFIAADASSAPFTTVSGAMPTAADALYPYQWDMRRMHAPAVWARLPVAATPPRVAILDGGVMDDHPDLVGQVDASVSTSYCSTSGGSNNTAGYPKYSTLIDFDAHPDWTPDDGCAAATQTAYRGHGTHLAGTIAARFGGGLVVGVAPDARIGAYKVFDRCRYTDDDGNVREDCYGAFDGPLFSAIVQATQAGYPVINMSLGDYGEHADKGSKASWLAWDRIAKWADRNNTLIVASAGNAAISLNGTVFHVPSDLPTVLGVAATSSSQLQMIAGELNVVPGSDVPGYRSNSGAAVEVAAPGGDCGPGGLGNCAEQYMILNTGIDDVSGDAIYLSIFGTSMAAAHTSAVAAYVRSIHPDWSPGKVRAWLKSTAEPIGSRQVFGAGLIDADAATR